MNDVRFEADHRRMSQRVYLNGQYIGEILDLEFFEHARAKVEIAFKGLQDSAMHFIVSMTQFDVTGAWKRLEWALMTKAQRRRWGRRYSREMRGFKMRTERLS